MPSKPSFSATKIWWTLVTVCKEREICQHFAVQAQGLGTAEQFIFNEHAQSKIYDFCSLDDIPHIVAELQQIKGIHEY